MLTLNSWFIMEQKNYHDYCESGSLRRAKAKSDDQLT